MRFLNPSVIVPWASSWTWGEAVLSSTYWEQRPVVLLVRWSGKVFTSTSSATTSIRCRCSPTGPSTCSLVPTPPSSSKTANYQQREEGRTLWCSRAMMTCSSVKPRQCWTSKVRAVGKRCTNHRGPRRTDDAQEGQGYALPHSGAKRAHRQVHLCLRRYGMETKKVSPQIEDPNLIYPGDTVISQPSCSTRS